MGLATWNILSGRQSLSPGVSHTTSLSSFCTGLMAYRAQLAPQGLAPLALLALLALMELRGLLALLVLRGLLALPAQLALMGLRG